MFRFPKHEKESWKETISYLDDKEGSGCVDLFYKNHFNEVNYENVYRYFEEYCEQIEGKIDLCGLSIGSLLALDYALKHPKKVNSMVLIAARDKMPGFLLKLQNFIFGMLPEKLFQEIGLSKKDTLNLMGSMKGIDFSYRLQDMNIPTLLLCGSKDSANRKASERLSYLLRNATLYFIDNAGQEVNKDKPKALAERLNLFWFREDKIR